MVNDLAESADAFAAERPLLTAAVENCSIGVALFDLDLYCIAVNSGFPLPSLLRPHSVGKTALNIFGASSQVEVGLDQVRDSGEALRDIEFNTAPVETDQPARWLADFFPVGRGFRPFRVIGVAFSPLIRSSRLEGLLGRVASFPPVPRADSASGCDREMASLSDDCADVCRRTLDLLDRSRALRRRVTELRISASLVFDRNPRFGAGAVAQPVEVVLPLDESSPAEADAEDHSFRSPTPRELQIVRLLAEGQSNKEIAAVLKLSIRTVETYRARLMTKLKVHSAAEIVRYAIRRRFIEA